MVIVLLKPKIPENYNAFCSISESNKQNPRGRTLDLPFFCYEHITSLKTSFACSRLEFALWFRGNFCGCVSVDLPAERISFVCSPESL